MRLLILKLTATLALWLAGCNMPSVTPQPVTPSEPQKVVVEVKVSDGKLTVNDATISVNQTRSSGDSARCDCGCSQDDCRCSSRSARSLPSQSTADTRAGSSPQIVSALKDSKPVVEMLTDFDDGGCGACDLAWRDWRANGKDWPFVLVKKRGTGGRTSPTFLIPGREPWSPSSYSVGALLQAWRSRQ